MSPRSTRTNQEMREQSRERILDAAVEVFAEKGYQNATISDITTRAGVSRGLITYYFPEKRHLLDEFLGSYLGGLLTAVRTTGTPDERLAAMIDGVLGTTVGTLPVHRFALSLMIHPSTHPMFGQVELGLSEQLSRFEDSLRALFADRGAEEPDLEEVFFRSVLEGAIFKACVYGDAYPMERVRARMYRMYDLPAPRTPLVMADPPPIGRMRAADR